MKKHYSISDLSNEFDITTRTLRFYEEKGLLSPRREGQSRVYSEADRVRLRLILRGKRLGLSLDESKDIILMYDPAGNNKKQLQTLIDRIRAKQRQLKQQENDLKVMILDLKDYEQRCLEALANDRDAGAA